MLFFMIFVSKVSEIGGIAMAMYCRDNLEDRGDRCN